MEPSSAAPEALKFSRLSAKVVKFSNRAILPKLPRVVPIDQKEDLRRESRQTCQAGCEFCRVLVCVH